MRITRWTSFLMTALACATVAQAQTTAGSFRGQISTKDKGALPATSVTIRNTETGYSRSATADERGTVSLTLLPVGTYRVRVTAPGFKTAETRVKVNLGETAVLNLELDRDVASAVVEVVAAMATVDTKQVNAVASVDESLVRAVPLVTRNFTDMARLSPGVVSGSGTRMVVEGGRQIFNAIQIDGASNNSAFFNEQRGGVYTPFIFGADTIRELQVVTNGYDVIYGQAGATVNAITKNGTNELTGSALYQVRRTSLSAAPKAIPYDPFHTFNTPTNLQRFNDSSNINFNVGGPIIKDKLWYFAGVERFHKSITSNPVPTPISTAAGMTQTDFNNLLSSPLGKVVTNQSGLTLAQEFGNPGTGIAPHAYPMENTNTVYFGRLDYSLNENHRFVLRCNYQTMTDTLQNTSANPNNAESNNIPTLVNSISWVLEANSIWTNEIFTETRLQLAREARPMHGNAAPGVPSISIPNSTSFMAFGTKTSTPRESNENTMQFFTATTWNHGDIQVKGGVELMKVDVDNQFFQNNAGAWNFGTYGAAADWANGALQASPSNGNISYSGAVSPLKGRILMGTKSASVFGQIQYSALMDKRLTLTAGLRTYNQSFTDNPQPNPNFQGLDQGQGGHTLDPRLAFSLDVDGKGKTVIRGGIGSFTSPTPLLLHSNTMTGNGQIITNYGFSLNRANATILNYFNNGALSASNLISGTSMRKLTDAELAALAGSGAFKSGSSSTSLWDPANKLSQSKKIGLGVEHDFGNSFVMGVSAAYVRYENLQRFENINLGQVDATGALITGGYYNDGYASNLNSWTTGPTAQHPEYTRPGFAIIGGRRVDFNKASITPGNPVGGFSDVYLVKTDGWGYYRGLSLTAKKTWNEKTGFFANATYAKAQDTGSFERGTYTSSSSNFSSELGASLVPDQQNPASNYGFGDSDRRWVVNAVAYFPVVWGIEASIRGLFQTGLPFTAYNVNDLNGDGMANHVFTGHTRNDLRQPNYTQFDVRISRSFKIYGKLELEGIIDIYNLFNKADFTVPSPNGYFINTTAGGANPAFGQLAAVSKDKTREVQLGIRARF